MSCDCYAAFDVFVAEHRWLIKRSRQFEAINVNGMGVSAAASCHVHRGIRKLMDVPKIGSLQACCPLLPGRTGSVAVQGYVQQADGKRDATSALGVGEHTGLL